MVRFKIYEKNRQIRQEQLAQRPNQAKEDRTRGIRIFIQFFQEVGVPEARIRQQVKTKFKLTESELSQCWPDNE